MLKCTWISKGKVLKSMQNLHDNCKSYRIITITNKWRSLGVHWDTFFGFSWAKMYFKVRLHIPPTDVWGFWLPVTCPQKGLFEAPMPRRWTTQPTFRIHSPSPPALRETAPSTWSRSETPSSSETEPTLSSSALGFSNLGARDVIKNLLDVDDTGHSFGIWWEYHWNMMGLLYISINQEFESRIHPGLVKESLEETPWIFTHEVHGGSCIP